MITPTTLKNAAFAIEHDLFTDPDGCNYLVKDGAILRRWEPLADDGDAFRLLVSLRLEITVFRDHVTAFHATSWCDELHGSDPLAATRLAIVRAAAEIGASINSSPENH